MHTKINGHLPEATDCWAAAAATSAAMGWNDGSSESEYCDSCAASISLGGYGYAAAKNESGSCAGACGVGGSYGNSAGAELKWKSAPRSLRDSNDHFQIMDT
jgi:hypothetical protein